MKKLGIVISILFLLNISILNAKDVLYGGDSIGMNVQFEGIMVNGIYQFDIEKEHIDPSIYIKEKDIILEVNGIKITTISNFYEALDHYKSKYNTIPITIKRNDLIIHTNMISSFQNNSHQIGLYLKENIIGIGTMTYYDYENNTYGALGHAISENKNQKLNKGIIYSSTITGIQKAQMNDSGSKIGNINYENKIGTIQNNNSYGIFGKYEINTIDVNKKIEVADVEDIKVGEATLLTVLSDNKIESFTLNIKDFDLNKKEKAITIEITDKELLRKTGGIIHGMSGSPIIQNNKIIGAITHVDVEEPYKGYAIFIQTMLDESNKSK